MTGNAEAVLVPVPLATFIVRLAAFVYVVSRVLTPVAEVRVGAGFTTIVITFKVVALAVSVTVKVS